MGISENIKLLKEIIPSNVTLIAVSKTKSVNEIEEAYEEGIVDFGENKVQEFIEKYDILKYKDINWHFIGHLQRNKVKYIVGKVFLIHSLDSIKLLQEIDKQYKQKNITAQVLIEVNIGREPSKYGFFKEDLEDLIQEVERCTHVKVKGLMAIIPKGDEEQSKRYFNEMKVLFDSLKIRTFNNIHMDLLSMGMSGDYKIAIDEGANIIRIGEGIFGKRVYNNI